jgi:hypothetical protein
VLTAARNVGCGELFVHARQSRWPATVLLRGDEESADLALLQIDSDGVDVPRFRYGTVDKTVSGFVDSCWPSGSPPSGSVSSSGPTHRPGTRTGPLSSAGRFQPWRTSGTTCWP